MNNTTNQKKETKITTTKVNAILYSITSVIWLFTAGLTLYSNISIGKSVGWNFVTDLSLAVVFGSLAISYAIKYRKEKAAEETDTTIVE